MDDGYKVDISALRNAAQGMDTAGGPNIYPTRIENSRTARKLRKQ